MLVLRCGRSTPRGQSDLALPEEEPADWFGTAFHRRTTVVPDKSHKELLTYNFTKQRYWRIEAVNRTSGERLGGLKLASNFFTPPIREGSRTAGFAKEDTYHGNHWWLTQDIHVVNATGRRDATVLLARSTEPGYDMHRATAHPLAEQTQIDRPVIFCAIKLVHEVRCVTLRYDSNAARHRVHTLRDDQAGA